MLQPVKDAFQSFLIIDGQQRIATLSLLSLAIAKLLRDWAEDGIERDDNLIRYEKERERYIGNFFYVAADNRPETAPQSQ